MEGRRNKKQSKTKQTQESKQTKLLHIAISQNFYFIHTVEQTTRSTAFKRLPIHTNLFKFALQTCRYIQR